MCYQVNHTLHAESQADYSHHPHVWQIMVVIHTQLTASLQNGAQLIPSFHSHSIARCLLLLQQPRRQKNKGWPLLDTSKARVCINPQVVWITFQRSCSGTSPFIGLMDLPAVQTRTRYHMPVFGIDQTTGTKMTQPPIYRQKVPPAQ
jgi:hypothetical protein